MSELCAWITDAPASSARKVSSMISVGLRGTFGFFSGDVPPLIAHSMITGSGWLAMTSPPAGSSYATWLRSRFDGIPGRMNDEPKPSSRSQRALDAFAFFLADVQTGWGPFVAAYLTSVAWRQLDIGLVLTAGTLAS